MAVFETFEHQETAKERKLTTQTTGVKETIVRLISLSHTCDSLYVRYTYSILVKAIRWKDRQSN
jgi:hypothetical protein